MQKPRSSKDKSVSIVADKNKEAEKLRQEIRELKSIVQRCEWSLDKLRFKDVESTVAPGDPISSYLSKTPNVETRLQNDLYGFAGFRCVKFRRQEFVFNFASASEQQKDDTYAVQIFIKDGKGSLGKWVMPMSVNMNYVLTKTPIDELKHLTNFVKRCKHNIDCYAIRREQFLLLKKCVSHIKNCTLQSNTGYTQINLELNGVHDNENDKYINLIIYLLYHSDEARPHKVKVDTMDKKKLSNETTDRLKACLKEFKILDLQTAFDKVLLEDNSAFTWMLTNDSESPLELNDTSSSDEEGFLVQLQSERKKSLRKAKKKRELQKKWVKRKKQKRTSQNIASLNNDDDNA